MEFGNERGQSPYETKRFEHTGRAVTLGGCNSNCTNPAAVIDNRCLATVSLQGWRVLRWAENRRARHQNRVVAEWIRSDNVPANELRPSSER